MNTFEKCKRIRSIILRRAAEVISYKWDAEFAVSTLGEIETNLRKKEDIGLYDIQPSDLTATEMEELDFGKWTETSEMMLIPLWLFPYLADNIIVNCIDGTTVMKKSEMDNDNRFGCLAYGVTPKQ